jgi:1-phosphofructokinase
MAAEPSTVVVFTPSVYTSITIEGDADHQDIHIHAGGQGIWVARMIRHLGAHPVVCAPLGGESGRALRGLIQDWGIELSPVLIEADSPAYVHDRRSGERNEIARSQPPSLDRHELDELYGTTLKHSLAAGICVMTGRPPGDTIPVEIFERFGADMAGSDVDVVGDLHGEELDAFLAGGPVRLLKVSDEDLVEDGLPEGHTEDQLVDAIRGLMARGAERVVVSRADQPAIAAFPEGLFRIQGPTLRAVDAKGAGDSMTAALATALVRRLDVADMLRLASAAGAANVTRHGLGSADPDLIAQLTEQVEVERMGDAA